jgi:hypothetical protein
MGEDRHVYEVSLAKFEGKRALGRPRCRWEEVFRMYLKEIRWGEG